MCQMDTQIDTLYVKRLYFKSYISIKLKQKVYKPISQNTYFSLNLPENVVYGIVGGIIGGIVVIVLMILVYKLLR